MRVLANAGSSDRVAVLADLDSSRDREVRFAGVGKGWANAVPSQDRASRILELSASPIVDTDA